VSVALGLADPLSVGEGLGDGVGDGVGVGPGDGDGLGEPLSLGEGEGLGATLSVGLGEGDGDGDGRGSTTVFPVKVRAGSNPPVVCNSNACGSDPASAPSIDSRQIGPGIVEPYTVA